MGLTERSFLERMEEMGFTVRKSNADRIRAMTDEELAMLLGAQTIVFQPWCNMDYDCPYIDQDPARCDLCALDWLKREVSDGT